MAPARRDARRARGRPATDDRRRRGDRATSRRHSRVDAETLVDIARALAIERGDDAGADMLFWAEATRSAIESHRRDLDGSAEAARLLGDSGSRSWRRPRGRPRSAMEFGFLLDHDRKLLSIGYLVAEGTLDPSCYDLLASEARLASFMAIAKGDVPARHWFRLGRAVTPVAHGAALISWSGSMFEYLMPSLVMRAPDGSLIEQTSRLIVRRQIDYGATLGVPWGVSESAYNVRDLEFTYQYSNFGVPGLGLKRGLGENVVVAPLCDRARGHGRSAGRGAQLRPARRSRCERPLRLLRGAGLHAEPPAGRQESRIVRAFMAHHQGMTIVAIADALLDGAMRARFHAEPIVQATELLLQERAPRDVAVAHPWAADGSRPPESGTLEPPGGRRLTTAHGATPVTQLLSNGRYAVMLTAAGSGYSRWRDLAVTRWREDATCDDWGSYVFLRDVDSGNVWSAGFQPSGVEPDDYDVTFNEDRAEFTRRDGTLTTTLEVARLGGGRCRGPPRLDIELRHPRAGHRRHVLRRARAGAPGCRRRRIRRFPSCSSKPNIGAEVGAILATRRRRVPERAGNLGRTSRGRRRRRCGKARGGNRPGAIPRPRPRLYERRSR